MFGDAEGGGGGGGVGRGQVSAIHHCFRGQEMCRELGGGLTCTVLDCSCDCDSVCLVLFPFLLFYVRDNFTGDRTVLVQHQSSVLVVEVMVSVEAWKEGFHC